MLNQDVHSVTPVFHSEIKINISNFSYEQIGVSLVIFKNKNKNNHQPRVSVLLKIYLILIKLFLFQVHPKETVKDTNIFWSDHLLLFFKLKLLLTACVSLPCACIIWSHIQEALVLQEIMPHALIYFYVLATKSPGAHLLAPVHHHGSIFATKGK